VLGERDYHVTLSIGNGVFPSDGNDSQALLKAADVAMYRAKASGRNNHLFYSPSMNVHTAERLELESDLDMLISPMDFIPIAEETGLIVPIGEWVLATACARNKVWQDQGLGKLSVAVNLSARPICGSDAAPEADRIIHESGLDPSSLELEITESVVDVHGECAVAALEN